MSEIIKGEDAAGRPVEFVAPAVAGDRTDNLVRVKMLRPRLVGSHNYQPGDEFEVDAAVAAEIQRAGDGIAEVKTVHGQYIPPSDGVHPVDPRLIPAPESPPPPPEATGEVRTNPPRPAPSAGQPEPGQEKAVDYKEGPAKPASPKAPPAAPAKPSDAK
ncbi:hypothetical protein [Paludisphaera sp.]|uniref:hypothetical protein n=1 Tax=Paludisphaera sp. TaxID=2017432 RepID=UPI00301D596E